MVLGKYYKNTISLVSESYLEQFSIVDVRPCSIGCIGSTDLIVISSY